MKKIIGAILVLLCVLLCGCSETKHAAQLSTEPIEMDIGRPTYAELIEEPGRVVLCIPGDNYSTVTTYFISNDDTLRGTVYRLYPEECSNLGEILAVAPKEFMDYKWTDTGMGFFESDMCDTDTVGCPRSKILLNCNMALGLYEQAKVHAENQELVDAARN